MSTIQITGWRRYTFVEPLILAIFFAFAASGNIMTDMIIFQTCLRMPGYNSTKCSVIHEHSTSKEAIELEEKVQPLTSSLLILKSCIETIFPAVLSLFLGPWSDKYGRKPLLIVGFFGFTLGFLLLSVMSEWELDPYLFLLPMIPSSLLGGFSTVMLTFYCYVSDISDDRTRSWHLAWLDSAMFAGLLGGMFTGPILFKEFGYSAVFGASMVSCFAALLYTVFFVPETIYNEESVRRTIGSIFDVTLVKDLISSVRQKRSGFNRFIVWSCIACIVIHVTVSEGHATIIYLFVCTRLGWDIWTFSVFAGMGLILAICGLLIMFKIMKNVFDLKEISIVLVANLSSIAGLITKAFACKPWHMYLSMGIGIFGGAAIPVIRAILSKSVPPQDIGKVFSITTTLEMIAPFATTPLYIWIYTKYMPPIYPCPVWLMSVGFISVILLIVIGIWRHLRKDAQYAPLLRDAR